MEIIGGNDAKPHSRPYMALLTSNGFICGGTLIKANWVLTAAHCRFDKMEVILGAHQWGKRENEQQRFTISKSIPHPEFEMCTKRNDIQLVQLNRAAQLNKFVSVFPLPTSDVDMKAGTVCNTAGWGITSTKNKIPSSILRETNLTIVDRAVCHKIYQKTRPKEDITNDMLCAGPLKRRKDDACLGDSGGPFICGDKLQGIVSFGHKCGNPKIPGVYTRLTTKYLKWIKTTIGGAF
ncbi:granzyme A-like [Pelodytes ibericus]